VCVARPCARTDAGEGDGGWVRGAGPRTEGGGRGVRESERRERGRAARERERALPAPGGALARAHERRRLPFGPRGHLPRPALATKPSHGLPRSAPAHDDPAHPHPQLLGPARSVQAPGGPVPGHRRRARGRALGCRVPAGGVGGGGRGPPGGRRGGGGAPGPRPPLPGGRVRGGAGHPGGPPDCRRPVCSLCRGRRPARPAPGRRGRRQGRRLGAGRPARGGGRRGRVQHPPVGCLQRRARQAGWGWWGWGGRGRRRARRHHQRARHHPAPRLQWRRPPGPGGPGRRLCAGVHAGE
jgi:translation initiation factor IF-2